MTSAFMIITSSKKDRPAGTAEVWPVYCFDPRNHGTTRFGSQKTGYFRTKFLLESVDCLRRTLQKFGSNLIIRHEKPEIVFPMLLEGCSGGIVLCQEETTSEELRIDNAVQKAIASRGVNLQKVWGITMIHKDDLPFKYTSEYPNVYTVFRQKVESYSPIRDLTNTPKTLQAFTPSSVPNGLGRLPTLASLGFSGFQTPSAVDELTTKYMGGEEAALQRLKHYIWDSDSLKSYKLTRNGMIGTDYSSKFSLWLANGCLSPRMVYHEVKKYERERVANDSTYWLIFEMLWRDFFRFYCMKHGDAVFKIGGPMRNYSKKWSTDEDAVARWKGGTTGVPLIDANMRELAATGFQSNRGRQNVASFLCLDLGVDWRIGADHFESLLIDHDVCSNYGNWVSAAGLNGGRINRFNAIKQGYDYDKDGKYVRLWCPELKNVPAKYIHEPWSMPADVQQRSNCVIGIDYPQPLFTPPKPHSAPRSGHSQKFYKKGFRGEQAKGTASAANRKRNLRQMTIFEHMNSSNPF